jgi:hypothetical protein
MVFSHRRGARDCGIEFVGVWYVAYRERIIMFTAYVVVTVLAAGANIYAATNDFRRVESILTTMARLGVPESRLPMLGILKAAGALGLLVGIGIPLIGVAAAIGLVLFFVAAIITHLRARDYSLGPAVVFFLLALGSLVLRLASL